MNDQVTVPSRLVPTDFYPIGRWTASAKLGGAERLDRRAELVEFRSGRAADQQVALAESRIVEHVERLVFAAHQINQLFLERVLEEMRHRWRGKAHEVARPDLVALAIDLRHAASGENV